MLIDEPQVEIDSQDSIMALLARARGEECQVKRLQTGVYQIGHFGSSHFLSEYHRYTDDLSINSYGVCDTVEQVIEQCPELKDEVRKFVITVTPIRKSEQSPKWGPYIGKHTPTTKYLYDEKSIEEVLVYHIYEKK